MWVIAILSIGAAQSEKECPTAHFATGGEFISSGRAFQQHSTARGSGGGISHEAPLGQAAVSGGRTPRLSAPRVQGTPLPPELFPFNSSLHSMLLRDALRVIRSRRPCVKPNKGFLQQLREYETLLASPTPALARTPVMVLLLLSHWWCAHSLIWCIGRRAFGLLLMECGPPWGCQRRLCVGDAHGVSFTFLKLRNQCNAQFINVRKVEI